VETGPYAPGQQGFINVIRTTCQRFLVDRTIKIVKGNFYPIDDVNVPKPYRLTDNGHKISGAVRDEARRVFVDTAERHQFCRYELSPSVQSKAEFKCHLHYAVGDLVQPMQIDSLPQRALITGIDIDYYITDPDYVLQHMRPCLFHSFNPRLVSGMDGESPYTITDNIVTYSVSGGGEWKHPVWDWCASGEFIRTKVHLKWWERVLCFLLPIEKIGYHKVHHARPWLDCPERILVWTIPESHHWQFKNIPSTITSRQLKRVNYNDTIKAGWNRLHFIGDDTHEPAHTNTVLVSIGKQGQLVQAKIPLILLEAFLGLSTTQAITTRMISLQDQYPLLKDRITRDVILQYYTGKVVETVKTDMLMKPIIPRVHWPVTGEMDQPEVNARCYSQPIVNDHMLLPMIKRWEVMSESLERRVTFVANKKIPAQKYKFYLDEYMRLLLNGVSDLEPYSIEETIERLNKPSQQLFLKAILEVLDVEPSDIISSFNKNEASMKSSRIISGYSDIKFILLVSRYSLKFTDAILKAEHNNHWYYPGLTPKEIAARVQKYVVQEQGRVIETDYTNLDGTVSAWMQQHIGEGSYLRAFKPEYRDEIRKWWNSIIYGPAEAKRFGFRYDPGVGVKSGSPTTTPENTKYNAFVEYCALRETRKLATAEECFYMIGPKAGDDGLAHDSIYNTIGKIGKSGFGLKIKCEKYNPEMGLGFLGRVFIDPINTQSTIQDPLRTIRKLHLTTRHNLIPLSDACLDRVEGYAITDRYTPLISDYVNSMIRLHTPTASSAAIRAKRSSRNNEKPYWLQCDGSWPQHEIDIPKMREILEQRTGIDTKTLDTLISNIRNMKSVEDVITIERTDENQYKDTVLEDGLCDDPVDSSLQQQELIKLENAKQVRVNQGITKQCAKGNRKSTTNGLQRCTTNSDTRHEQLPKVFVKYQRQNNQRSGFITSQTNSSELSERPSTSRETTSRRSTSTERVGNPQVRKSKTQGFGAKRGQRRLNNRFI